MKNQISTKLKKGDQVVVTTGRDKGKVGRILKMVSKNNAALIEKVNMVKRHTKPEKDQEGGIVEKESPISLSNVMFLDVTSGKGVRLGKKILEDGRKVRIIRGSGEVIDK